MGRTERELARRLELVYLELGADAAAFEIGLAAGANGAVPHGKPSQRVIDEGTAVVVDSGARVDGYYSDCTRTFATGQLPGELARAYDVCLRAQERALAAVEPGLPGAELDTVARAAVEWAGLGERFGHLGHGVGLEVHEDPRLAPDSDETLEVGNVVTIEPGIYLSGLGGVRIEDLVIVSAHGPEVLTKFRKELVTVR